MTQKLPISHKKIVAVVTILFIAIILLLLGGARTVFVLAVRTNEANLGERLVTKGQSLAVIIESNYLDLLPLVCPQNDDLTAWEYYRDSPMMERLEAALEQFKERAALEGVQLICESGWVLASTTDDLPAGEPNDLLNIDAAEIERALSEGQPQSTIPYRLRNEPLKRTYVPILDASGRARALVRLEASRTYFKDLAKFRNDILMRGMIVLALMLVLFLIFQRLLRSILKAEERMAEAERFQAMGTLAAGLAHELRNPLGIIRATTENLKDELPEREVEAQKLLSYIVDETERMNQLIVQFLQLAREERPGSQGAEQCDAVRTVNEVLNLMRKGFEKEHIRFSVIPNGPIPQVAIPEKALRQVILNVLINARDALKRQPEGDIALEFSQRRQQVILDVRDNGPGIPADMIKQIMNPFFTTKTSGTGLGLTISRSLMERSGGDLKIANGERGGCVVSIVMPKVNEG